YWCCFNRCSYYDRKCIDACLYQERISKQGRSYYRILSCIHESNLSLGSWVQHSHRAIYWLRVESFYWYLGLSCTRSFSSLVATDKKKIGIINSRYFSAK